MSTHADLEAGSAPPAGPSVRHNLTVMIYNSLQSWDPFGGFGGVQDPVSALQAGWKLYFTFACLARSPRLQRWVARRVGPACTRTAAARTAAACPPTRGAVHYPLRNTLHES